MTDEERAAMLSGGIAELEPAIERALAAVRAEEREACAKVAADHLIFEEQYGDDAGAGADASRSIADAIRARSAQ